MEVAADIDEVDRSFESLESKEDDEKHYNDESDGEPPTD
jgi:hypothetical protein